jgi:hypothetical protein
LYFHCSNNYSHIVICSKLTLHSMTVYSTNF